MALGYCDGGRAVTLAPIALALVTELLRRQRARAKA
jgi:hypothetical protein